MKKIYLVVLFVLGACGISNAQESYWAINWDISSAMGETGDFVGGVNFRGVSVEGRYFIKSDLTIGGSLGWNTLYEKQDDLPPIEIEVEDYDGHLSGTQLHYVNTVPVLFTSHYYMEGFGKGKVFLGAGIGGVYAEQRNDIGLRSYYSDSFGFAFQPEIGTMIPIGYAGSGLNVAFKYLYGTSAGELDSLSVLTLSVGFSFLN